jgi:long-chain fatty acid transport protein
MRRRAAPVLTVLAAALFGPAVTAHATPQDLFGFGARTPGLAMTGVSYAADYEATHANPAGLARARRRGFHLGVGAGVFGLSLDGRRFPLDSARGMTIGATLPLPFHDILEERLVLGLGVYTPQQVLLRGQVLYSDVPQWPVLSRAQSVAINLGLGVDLHGTDLEGFRIGVGATALANVIGNLDVELDETQRFSSTVETQLLATFAPLAGVVYERDRWSAGLVYRHEVRSEMNLTIAVSDLPVTLPVLTVGGLVQYDPPQLAGEVSWETEPGVRVIANLTARFWSLYPGAQRSTSRSSPLAPAPAFSDTVSPRLAVEATLREGRTAFQIRGGYAFEATPSPPARMAPRRASTGQPLMEGGMPVLSPLRLLDNDRHVFTAGLGVTHRVGDVDVLRLDLCGQVHWLVDRQHEIPASGGPTGDASTWMRTGGVIVVGAWSLTLEF